MDDRITRRPITDNRRPAEVFQNPFRPFGVLPKLLPAHVVNEAVSITVRGDFMTLFMDGKDNLGYRSAIHPRVKKVAFTR